MDEKTCENCFWFQPSYETSGWCRNPRNAKVGRAGSDYSSSELLAPLGVRINQVCDLHEVGRPSTLRKVYELEWQAKPGVHYPWSHSDGDWVRKPLSPPTGKE